MIKIGVTGSLASGKTTVAKMFAGGNYPLFNADIAVRRIIKKIPLKTKYIINSSLKIKKILKKN